MQQKKKNHRPINLPFVPQKICDNNFLRFICGSHQKSSAIEKSKNKIHGHKFYSILVLNTVINSSYQFVSPFFFSFFCGLFMKRITTEPVRHQLESNSNLDFSLHFDLRKWFSISLVLKMFCSLCVAVKYNMLTLCANQSD